MNQPDSTFRRNLVGTLVVHGVLIGGLVIWEAFVPQRRELPPTFVEIVTPAALLGDLPTGPGRGTGAHKAPPVAPQPVTAQPPGGSTAAGLSEDESTPPPPAPRPQPTRTVAPPVSDPNAIAIPQKNRQTVKKPAPVEAPHTASTTKPTATTTRGLAKTAVSRGTTGKGPSADEIRRRFANALTSADNGSPDGDGKPAGGGDGSRKYGRLGHPDGATDGVVGGVGQGSPFWQYYLHVHDRMYEAWEKPNQLMDKNLRATVLLRISSDGTIDDVVLKRSSGNKVMDETALTAARRVARLNPPPAALMKGSEAPVTVDFELEG